MTATITSPQNEKLKLVRKLGERKAREREGLFVTEGEDLLEAGLRSGAEPDFVLSPPGVALVGVEAIEVERELLDGVSTLGSGTRAIAAWRVRWADAPAGPVCVYLHGIGDPGNVGAIVRSAHALADGTVVLGPECADPFSPKAVRASMGSVFGQPLARADIGATPSPRALLVAHGGDAPAGLRAPLTVCLGPEREAPPADVAAACDRHLTIPMREGAAESLNVAAAAAIVLSRIAPAEGPDAGKAGS